MIELVAVTSDYGHDRYKLGVAEFENGNFLRQFQFKIFRKYRLKLWMASKIVQILALKWKILNDIFFFKIQFSLAGFCLRATDVNDPWARLNSCSNDKNGNTIDNTVLQWCKNDFVHVSVGFLRCIWHKLCRITTNEHPFKNYIYLKYAILIWRKHRQVIFGQFVPSSS